MNENKAWVNPVPIGERRLCLITDWSEELAYQDLRIEKRFLSSVLKAWRIPPILKSSSGSDSLRTSEDWSS
jgi:hypothetical protein